LVRFAKGSAMRKKRVIGVVLVVILVAASLFLIGITPTAEPPLRVGMSAREVNEIMDSPGLRERQRESFVTKLDANTSKLTFVEASDWLGNRTAIEVYFDRDDRVESWHRISMPKVRPRWVWVTMKYLGR
jgi:hypothetical protein